MNQFYPHVSPDSKYEPCTVNRMESTVKMVTARPWAAQFILDCEIRLAMLANGQSYCKDEMRVPEVSVR